jgi:transposase
VNKDAHRPCRTDVTDEQWAVLEPLLLAFENRIRPAPERTVDRWEVVNTLRYQNRTGCQWALLPHDLLPQSGDGVARRYTANEASQCSPA